ncbi:MAG TPA: polyphosphate polymerase domain-containing protein [Bacteroides sp.]|nr:polyphosphate polymerase domain-containing protein [Bacteroides sp.]
MSIGNRIEEAVQEFRSIGLVELKEAELLRRKDAKFLFSISHIPVILQSLKDYYRVLEVDGRRAQNYQTVYYDTLDLDMYHMHHRGMVNRHKIRFRKYGSNDALFFEVKRKNAKGMTIKNRIRSESEAAVILSREEEFLNYYTPYENREMLPVLENSFKRITLVSPDQAERITLDYYLWFATSLAEGSIELPGISIAEIKYKDFISGSPFYTELRRQHIVPSRFSKYCIGMAVLNPGLKQNLFKEKIRRVRQLNSHYLNTLNQSKYA